MELIQAQLVLRRIVIVVVEVDSYVSVIFIGQITVQIAWNVRVAEDNPSERKHKVSDGGGEEGYGNLEDGYVINGC